MKSVATLGLCLGIVALTGSVAEAQGSRRIGRVAPSIPPPAFDAWPSENVVEASVPQVDRSDRAAVVAHFLNYYETSEGFAHGWTGNVAGCEPGSVASGYLAAALQRVNYYRSMVGLPANVTFDAAKNAMCQDAALMMSANGQLSHSPPASWLCYTATGAQAAGSSNLAAGFASAWSAIDGFMGDRGQPEVGHRRWILYPRLISSGFGATFGGSWSGYAMWVIGDWAPRPPEPEWVAWPPAGYVPYRVVHELWSFTLPGADFNNTTVSVTHEGSAVESNVYRLTPGFGDPGVSWSVEEFPIGAPAVDRVYRVQIGNVLIDSQPQHFDYDVLVIDPEVSLAVDPDAIQPPPAHEASAGLPRLRGHPNPFTAGTTLRFYVTGAATVRVEIFNVLGRRVRSLLDARRPVGWHTVHWDGRGDDGSRLAAGAYFARVAAGRQVVTRRLLLAR
jgi:uncharacterized protein YkwD